MSLSMLSSDELAINQKNEETTKLKLITPVIQKKWNDIDKIIMEYYFTDGRISIDEYNIAHRGKPKKVDYLLLHKDNILLAVVEAKGQDHTADEGYQQAIEYARLLDVPFAYSTNGINLIEHDMISGLNRYMKIDEFPTSDELWDRYKKEKNIGNIVENVYTYPYYTTIDGKKPRYYQRIAINRTVEAIAKGQNRLLLVLATGTGKTYLAYQIIYRFWKTRNKKKILFIADRNILVDQTMRNDFKPFADAMEKINNRKIDTSKEIYLGLYQQLKTPDEDYYKQLPSDFFDMIVVDECHRGSANADSNWREILDYFKSATQIGLTATPKDAGIEEAYNNFKKAKEKYEFAKKSMNYEEIKSAQNNYEKAYERKIKAEANSNTTYFGAPIYTYSLKQGIEDGFLAPYKVLSVELNIDKYGYLPPEGTVDADGNLIENRRYFQHDFDRNIIISERRKIVAKRITEFMKTNDCRFSKMILFCEDIEHCQEMKRLLENENADLVAEDSRYIMQITGDNEAGKSQLTNFIDPSSKYPVIAITSRLMSTGVDAQTCEIIVLDREIASMTEFKQIIGRGTRIKQSYEVDGEEKTKMYFTILDFRKNYLNFLDPEFDGDPIAVTTVSDDSPFPKPPIKPTDIGESLPKIPKNRKLARINGVDVEIIGEDAQWYDVHGNLVRQNLSSCVRNNIVTQYPTYEEFKSAWLIARDKEKFAYELLLEYDWSKSFKIQFGFNVDNFDIISYLGYDIEPISKSERAQNISIVHYLENYDDEKRKILCLLLDAYVETSFSNLKDIKNIFNQPKFIDIGYTPLKIIKQCFGTKEKYFEALSELENKLYE